MNIEAVLESLSLPIESHITAAVLATLLHVDESTVRRMFENEPGVLRIPKPSRKNGRREYFTMRIPVSVAARVLERMTVKGKAA